MNTYTLSLAKLEIQMLPPASEASPCALTGPPWSPFGCDTSASGSTNREILPFPVGDGSQLLQSPQPKLPNHTSPRGSIVTPKHVPRRSPPVRGDTGVPFLPSAGRPLGLSAMTA